MKQKKQKVKQRPLVVNTYKVLRMAVEQGVSYGWNRAHKYTDKPNEEDIKNAIEEAVMGDICEWFDFPEPASE